MAGRKFFITDIHGCFNEMRELIRLSGFDPTRGDTIVFGGDLIDRGPDSAKVLQYVYQMQHASPKQVVVLRGNHEDMMGQYFRKEGDMWLSFGQEAIQSFQDVLTDPAEFDTLIRYAISLPVMYMDDEYVYVHAGINPHRMTQLDEEILWMPYDNHAKTRFSDYAPEDILEWTDGRKVLHGHTPKKTLYDNGASMCCDLGAGTTETAKLALVNLTEDMYHCYDFVEKEYSERLIARTRTYVHYNK